ncbi:MAG: hypothetical protein J0L88_09645 [Xanthomonadales bacterium]|nr:hypothetical protein [Xanthomonadales bacterium]
MIDSLAIGVVLVTAMFLFALGIAALLAPERARRFLLGFAGSVARHVLEMSLRVLVGAAFLLAAPRMAFTDVFRLFGGAGIGASLRTRYRRPCASCP